MKKILLIGLVALLLMSGCEGKPQKQTTPEFNKEMSNDERYQLYKEASILDIWNETISLEYETETVDFDITATVNFFEEFNDPFVMITFFYMDDETDVYGSGTVYRMSADHPLYATDYDYTYETTEEDTKFFREKLKEYFGMDLAALKDFFVYVDENHNLNEEDRAALLKTQREEVVENQKLTTAVCSYEEDGFQEIITMYSNSDFSINQAIWQNVYDFSIYDETKIKAFIEEEKTKYADIYGATYDVNETSEQIETVLTISLTIINQSDLVKVGLVTEEGNIGVISLEESIKGFNESGYTCTSERK